MELHLDRALAGETALSSDPPLQSATRREEFCIIRMNGNACSCWQNDGGAATDRSDGEVDRKPRSDQDNAELLLRRIEVKGMTQDE